jgi:hypothetical protein
MTSASILVKVALAVVLAAACMAKVYVDLHGTQVDPPAGFTADVSQQPADGTRRATGTLAERARREALPAGAPGDGAPVGRDRGPVNDFGEIAIATSVQRAVRLRIGDVERHVSQALGRDVDLLATRTTCRSREDTTSQTGAPFTCDVLTTQTRSPVGRFRIGVLVTHVDGSCWRGVDAGYATAPYAPIRRYAAQTVEQRALRGCVSSSRRPPGRRR